MYKGELTFDEQNGCYVIKTVTKGYEIPYKSKRIKTAYGETKKDCRDLLIKFIDDFCPKGIGLKPTRFLHINNGDKRLVEEPIEIDERTLGPIIKIG